MAKRKAFAGVYDQAYLAVGIMLFIVFVIQMSGDIIAKKIDRRSRMKKMKKIYSALCAIALTLLLTACGKKDLEVIRVVAKEPTVDNPFVNVLVVKKGNENHVGILALIDILQSKEIKEFIDQNYQGFVIPA